MTYPTPDPAQAQDPRAYAQAAQQAGATDEAQQLAASGAKPVGVDYNTLLRQIREQQDRIAALEAAQPRPANPMESAVARLKENWADFRGAHPNLELTGVDHAVKLVIDALEAL